MLHSYGYAKSKRASIFLFPQSNYPRPEITQIHNEIMSCALSLKKEKEKEKERDSMQKKCHSLRY